MADTSWTKGPYLLSGHVVYALEEFRDRRGRYEQRNRITIQVDGGPDTPKEEVDAVKALLSAAPDMAEALTKCMHAFSTMSYSNGAIREAEDAARAALAKAMGEQ